MSMCKEITNIKTYLYYFICIFVLIFALEASVAFADQNGEETAQTANSEEITSQESSSQEIAADENSFSEEEVDRE